MSGNFESFDHRFGDGADIRSASRRVARRKVRVGLAKSNAPLSHLSCRSGDNRGEPIPFAAPPKDDRVADRGIKPEQLYPISALVANPDVLRWPQRQSVGPDAVGVVSESRPGTFDTLALGAEKTRGQEP